MNDGIFPEVLPSLLDTSDDDGSAGELILHPLVGSLAVAYTIEHDDRVFALTRAAVTERGVTPEALHERALANLARQVTHTGIRLNAYGAMMAVLFDGDTEATLMLYPPLWARLHDEIGEHLAVVVPARDVLAVAPADSSEGLADLRDVVDRVWPRDGRSLSRDLFGHRADGWSVLLRSTNGAPSQRTRSDR